MKLRYLVLGLILAGVGAAHADLYRYVDKDGRITYSDVPPPPDAKKIEKRKLTDHVDESEQLPYATQIAAKKYPVTLYANDCGEPCAKAKALLTKRGVPYALRNPEASLQDAQLLKKLVGALEVPTIVIGKDKPVKGFEEGSWNSALDSAGYPTSNTGVKANLVKESAKTQAKNTTAESKNASSSASPQANSPIQTEAGVEDGSGSQAEH
jgi:glutaredoxin